MSRTAIRRATPDALRYARAVAHEHDIPTDDLHHDNHDDPGFVDPHMHGACCHACGFAAEFEKSGVPPPAPGTPLMFPLDDAGVPKGAAVIVRQHGHERDADVYDVSKPQVQFGRVQGNDIVLPKGNITKRQMLISFADGAAIVMDSQSACGTFVNGKRISGPHRLCEGDRIYAGDFTVELVRIPS